MPKRVRVHVQYNNGNRIITPWYEQTDPRYAWFLQNVNQMTAIRVEHEDDDHADQ